MEHDLEAWLGQAWHGRASRSRVRMLELMRRALETAVACGQLRERLEQAVERLLPDQMGQTLARDCLAPLGAAQLRLEQHVRERAARHVHVTVDEDSELGCVLLEAFRPTKKEGGALKRILTALCGEYGSGPEAPSIWEALADRTGRDAEMRMMQGARVTPGEALQIQGVVQEAWEALRVCLSGERLRRSAMGRARALAELLAAETAQEAADLWRPGGVLRAAEVRALLSRRVDIAPRALASLKIRD